MSTELILPQSTADLSPTQRGWLKLESIKASTFTDLQNNELAIQQTLADFTTMDLEAIQAAIKKAKETASIAKDQRLQFTNMINQKLIEPAMAFEKRNDLLIGNAAAAELTKRKAAAEELDKANKLNKEKAQLKAHIENEFLRIGNEYRKALEAQLTFAYVHALEERMAANDVLEYMNEVDAQLQAILVSKPVKFNRVLVTDEQAKEVLATIVKYNAAADLEAAQQKLRGPLFAMYAEDLANATEAIQATQQAAQEQEQSADEEWALTTATNTLLASAEPLTMSGGPVVKRKQKIILEDSEEFAMRVLATFIKQWPTASKKLGTKSWTKLVDPFVKALDKLETQFPDFKYEEQCK